MNKILVGVLASATLLPLLAGATADSTTVGTTASTTQTGTVTPPPPKPPVGSGAMMERDMKGLHMAIGKLSPADRETLMKMIKDYLISKGIDPAKYVEMREEIKDMKDEMKDKMKDEKKAFQDKMKADRKAQLEKMKKMREEMKNRARDMRSGDMPPPPAPTQSGAATQSGTTAR